MKRSGSTLPGASSARPKHLSSVARRCGALSSLGPGTLPRLRTEELDLEELLSRSEFPFSEHCSLSDFTYSGPQPLGRREDAPSCLTDKDTGSRDKVASHNLTPGKAWLPGPTPYPGASPCTRLQAGPRAYSSCPAKSGKQLVPGSCLELPLPSPSPSRFLSL